MVAGATCRETIVRAMLAICVSAMAMTCASAQDADNSSDNVTNAIENTQRALGQRRSCQTASDGTIVVCGSDTEIYRLSPEERAIAGVGKSTKDSIPPSPYISPTVLDKLPYNWVSIGRYGRGAEYNPLYEMAKRATDPDTGVPPPLDEGAVIQGASELPPQP